MHRECWLRVEDQAGKSLELSQTYDYRVVNFTKDRSLIGRIYASRKLKAWVDQHVVWLRLTIFSAILLSYEDFKKKM